MLHGSIKKVKINDKELIGTGSGTMLMFSVLDIRMTHILIQPTHMKLLFCHLELLDLKVSWTAMYSSSSSYLIKTDKPLLNIRK